MTSRCQGLFPPIPPSGEKPWGRGCVGGEHSPLSVWAFCSVRTRKGLENVCFAAWFFKGHKRCPKEYDSPRGLCIGQISDFPRVSGLLQQLLRPPCSFFNLPRIRASLTANHKRWIQTCCEASWSFSGNRSRKSNSSLLFATRRLNLQHYILLQVGHACGNTRNKGFQLAMQHCCETSWRKMLPVLPDLNKKCQFYIKGSNGIRYDHFKCCMETLAAIWLAELLVYYQPLVELYLYTNENAVIWLAEPLHTISH